MSTTPIIILLVLFLVTLLLGVPFAWSLTFSCVCTLCFISGFPLMTVVQKMYNGYRIIAVCISKIYDERKSFSP